MVVAHLIYDTRPCRWGIRAENCVAQTTSERELASLASSLVKEFRVRGTEGRVLGPPIYRRVHAATHPYLRY